MLHLSDNKGRFHLYWNTSKVATGTPYIKFTMASHLISNSQMQAKNDSICK